MEDDIGLLDRGSQQILESKADIFHSQLSYYQWAQSKLNDARFDSERDKLIWECHSEGWSTRRIAPQVGLDQSWVVRKINRIKDSFKALGSMSMELGIA